MLVHPEITPPDNFYHFRDTTKLDAVDNRLSVVETKAAGYGTVAGGVMALAVSLISAKLTGKA